MKISEALRPAHHHLTHRHLRAFVLAGSLFSLVAGAGCGRDSLRGLPTPSTGNGGSDGGVGGGGGAGADAGTQAAIQSISIDPPAATLVKGSTRMLVVTAVYSDGTTGDVTAMATWSSSAASVATADAGVVSAVAAGTATITATVGSHTATASITVTAATVTAIAVLPGTATTAVGTTVAFRADATLSDGTHQDLTASASWTSSATGVATVGAGTGVATAVAAGTATITASFGGVSGSAHLTVTAATLTSIEVDPVDPTAGIGVAIGFTATGIYSDGTRAALTGQVTWTSSAPGTVSIDATGRATTRAAGQAVIRATLAGVTGTSTVTVTAATLVGITVSPTTSTVMVGGTVGLRAIGNYSDGSTVDLTTSVVWSAAPATTASVSNAAGTAGTVTALAVGIATITATSGTVSGTAMVTVSAARLVAIVINPAAASIPVGANVTLTAQGIFSDASVRDLTTQVAWQSSADTVATVANPPGVAGQVMGVSVGVVTITATLDGVSGTASITVVAATLQSIAVTPANATTTVGLRSSYTATGTFSDGTTVDLTTQVTWSTGNANVAAISNTAGAQGQLLARAAGTTTVTAALGGVTGSANVTVGGRVLVSLSIAPITPTTRLGTAVRFTATEIFSDGTQQNVTGQATWTSSNTGVATINRGGLATPVAVGTTTITATFMGLTASTTLTVTNAVVVSISVTPMTPTIPIGTTVQFTATAIFSDGTTQNVTANATWTSSAPGVLGVTTAGIARGRGTGVAAGTATVTATFMGLSGSTTATVTNAVPVSITVSPAGATLAVGGQRQFTAQAIFSDGTSQDVTARATWTSDTPGVAGVSDAAATRGLVTGVAGGTANITATFSGLSGSVRVTVNPATLTALQVTPFNQTVPVGTALQFRATGLFSDGTSSDLTASATWQSSLPGVAGVSDAAGTRGQASAVSSGTTQISATVMGVTGSTNLTVTAATIVAIQVTPFNPSLPAGFSRQLTATAIYSDGTNRDITSVATWTAANPGVATVSDAAASKGLVAAVSGGSTGISAQLSGQTGSTTVTVSTATLMSIAVTPAGPTAAAGSTVQFTATGTFSDGTTLDITTFVTWTSSNTAAADVSNADGSRGQASAFAAGTTTIKAQRGSITATTVLTVN
jgi:uncharacterized protein YjdB